ncbi:MAG: hypothetical protein GY810_03240 [Aureispira sp.]|nr:hypothetical protein [Aureispira sp.]
MTPQIEQIREEIVGLSNSGGDINMLESLANNTIYVLSKMQKSSETELPAGYRKRLDMVITDILSTVSKEIDWARAEEFNDEDEFLSWFAKAKQQLLNDIDRLFED